MTDECHCCGEPRPTETLGFREDDGDLWRVARVCEECREEELMPVLRGVFDGQGINMSSPEGDGWERLDPADVSAMFFAFEADTGTTHVARAVRRHIARRDEYRCVGQCGIEHDAEPEPRSRPLSARREGIIVCARCIRTAPRYVASAP